MPMPSRPTTTPPSARQGADWTRPPLMSRQVRARGHQGRKRKPKTCLDQSRCDHVRTRQGTSSCSIHQDESLRSIINKRKMRANEILWNPELFPCQSVPGLFSHASRHVKSQQKSQQNSRSPLGTVRVSKRVSKTSKSQQKSQQNKLRPLRSKLILKSKFYLKEGIEPAEQLARPTRLRAIVRAPISKFPGRCCRKVKIPIVLCYLSLGPW